LFRAGWNGRLPKWRRQKKLAKRRSHQGNLRLAASDHPSGARSQSLLRLGGAQNLVVQLEPDASQIQLSRREARGPAAYEVGHQHDEPRRSTALQRDWGSGVLDLIPAGSRAIYKECHEFMTLIPRAWKSYSKEGRAWKPVLSVASKKPRRIMLKIPK